MDCSSIKCACELHGVISGSSEITGTLSSMAELNGSLSGESTLNGTIEVYDGETIPTYVGEYEVTPSTETQILQTADKRMARDVTIYPVTGKSAETYTPNTSDQIIESGQYLLGDQTIKGDANLQAENIADGVTIFGVEGSLTAAEIVQDPTTKELFIS